MNRKYPASALALRAVFVVLAVAATLGIGGFIDSLATGYGRNDTQAQAPTATPPARDVALAGVQN
jgi:hypothetical protein